MVNILVLEVCYLFNNYYHPFCCRYFLQDCHFITCNRSICYFFVTAILLLFTCALCISQSCLHLAL
jgi:hypothetical protein